MMIMVLLLVSIMFGTSLSEQMGLSGDPALEQIVTFRERHPKPIGKITTSSGAPVSFTEINNTLNARLLVNEYFMDSMTHFIRERVPERLFHAKAAGAFGYFEVTHDIISHICRARLFGGVGKRTKVAVRFSHSSQETGGNDLDRNFRGFAVKFYTEDGIFDIVGINTPVFAIRDPVLFSSFIHSQRKNPATNLYDPNTVWDFITQRNETYYVYLMLFGDIGITDGYTHMPGYAIHTFQVESKNREMYFVRFHFTPDAGVKYISPERARKIQSVDPDYFTRDLYQAIGNKVYPSWTLSIQVLTLAQVKEAGSYVFDVTRTLPLDKYPLRPVGKLVLNQNIVNHFLEVEQIAFSPANLVPGILGAPDHFFEGRRIAYREAQSYRLGVNYNKISVNCPFHSLTNNRDGRPPVGSNGLDIPNYYPNSFNGPVAYADDNSSTLIELVEDEANNLQETRDYVNRLSEDQLNRLVVNVLDSLRPVVRFIQERAVRQFTVIHPDLGSRIGQGLKTLLFRVPT